MLIIVRALIFECCRFRKWSYLLIVSGVVPNYVVSTLKNPQSLAYSSNIRPIVAPNILSLMKEACLLGGIVAAAVHLIAVQVETASHDRYFP